MTREELAQKIWNEWEQGLAYQKKLRLKEICEQCVDFFEGRQWPQATEKTKNLPRPVINIIKFIIIIRNIITHSWNNSICFNTIFKSYRIIINPVKPDNFIH